MTLLVPGKTARGTISFSVNEVLTDPDTITGRYYEDGTFDAGVTVNITKNTDQSPNGVYDVDVDIPLTAEVGKKGITRVYTSHTASGKEVLYEVSGCSGLIVELNPDGIIPKYLVVLTIKDGSSTIVPKCEVVITDSSAGDSIRIRQQGFTNDSGRIEFPLPPGTFYLWRNKTGYEFDDPQTITVDSAGTVTLS